MRRDVWIRKRLQLHGNDYSVRRSAIHYFWNGFNYDYNFELHGFISKCRSYHSGFGQL